MYSQQEQEQEQDPPCPPCSNPGSLISSITALLLDSKDVFTASLRRKKREDDRRKKGDISSPGLIHLTWCWSCHPLLGEVYRYG